MYVVVSTWVKKQILFLILFLSQPLKSMIVILAQEG